MLIYERIYQDMTRALKEKRKDEHSFLLSTYLKLKDKAEYLHQRQLDDKDTLDFLIEQAKCFENCKKIFESFKREGDVKTLSFKLDILYKYIPSNLK